MSQIIKLLKKSAHSQLSMGKNMLLLLILATSFKLLNEGLVQTGSDAQNQQLIVYHEILREKIFLNFNDNVN